MHPIVIKPSTIRLVKLYRTGKYIGTKMYRFYTDKTNEIELPPEPTTCCMAGCANCVWIQYAEELIKIFNGNSEKAIEIILDKIQDANLKAFLSHELRMMQNRVKDPKMNSLNEETENNKYNNDDNYNQFKKN